MSPSKNICSSALLCVVIIAVNISFSPGAQKKNDTLAVIEKKAITVGQFERLYKNKLLTVGLTDNGEIRMKYLQNLVDDEILIARAKRSNLEKTKEAQAELSRLQVQELLNAYVAKHISGVSKVTESDLKDFFIALNTKVKVRHLYAQTKEEADLLHRQLMEGKTFAELGQKTFSDPVLKNNGGDLGYVSVDEMDPDFEKAAFGMKTGEISKPVKTVQGYSIIHVDDKKVNPLLTEQEFSKSKERIRTFVRKRKMEAAAKSYTANLRKELRIKFNRPLLAKLFETTQQQPMQNMIENPSQLISSGDLKKTIVSSSVQSWSVKELIEVLIAASKSQRKWIKTEENFEDYIAGLIMRDHITRQARKEKLDTTPRYHETVRNNFDTYLLTSFEHQLKQQISFSQDSLQAYYLQHKQDFMNPVEIRLSGILLGQKEIADSVQSLLTAGASFEETAKRYSVQIQTAAKGGDLGFFCKKDLGSLGEEISGLRVGEWKGPVFDDGKYLFLKCTEMKQSTYRAFEECAKEIEEVLTSQAWLKNRSSIVDSFKNEIQYRVYPERVATISLSLSN